MIRSERVEQFFAELKRRRVIRALVAYGIAAFAVLQIIEPVMHGLHWPDAVLSYVVVALAIGFPVVVALAWAFDVKEGRIERAPAGERRGWRLAAVVLALGVVAAAPGVVYFFVLRKPAGPEAAAPPSIAVLPFINMSSDKETDYFSDGITEELINALAHIDGLRVASRTAVFATKGKELGIQQLGQQLNVGTLLEGSVRREGNALRITAQLIKVSDGYHLWSESYDRESKGIFAIENEIARAIAGALRRKLAGVKQGTSDVAAHDLYLQGRFYWNKRTREGIRKAIGFLEEATRRDPAYALAWNGLADALTLRVEYDGARRDEVLPRAKEAARRALELDPSLGEAHASLGLIANAERDYPSAEAEYRTAIELSPNYALPHMWLGLVLMNDGRLDRAREEMERALQLDPLSLIEREPRRGGLPRQELRRGRPAVPQDPRSRPGVHLEPRRSRRHAVDAGKAGGGARRERADPSAACARRAARDLSRARGTARGGAGARQGPRAPNGRRGPAAGRHGPPLRRARRRRSRVCRFPAGLRRGELRHRSQDRARLRRDPQRPALPRAPALPEAGVSRSTFYRTAGSLRIAPRSPAPPLW